MVAVTDNGVVPITVVAGDEASGLARIIGQYLEQLLADSPEKRADAAAMRGRLGLRAREGDVTVTIVFSEDGIAVREGLEEPDAVIAGEVEFLMHVLAGRANPAWELCRQNLSLRSSIRRPFVGYHAYRLLRLPGVHLWSGLPRPPAGMVAGAVVVLGVLIVWNRRRRAVGGDDA